MKKLLQTLVLFLALYFSVGNVPIQANDNLSGSILSEEVGQGDLVILYTNDAHARVSANMGYAGVSALKKHFLAKGATVLLLDAGDAFQGLPFASLDQGKSIVDCMNLAGYDVMTPGCQDFNYGTEHLLSIRKNMKFELICGNIIKKADSSALLDSYKIIEKNGLKVGIFGLITPNVTYKTNPENVKELEFQDPIERASQIVKELQEKEVDYIVALTSVGKEVDPKSTTIAAKVDGINLIVDGHSHAPMGSGERINNTLVVSAGDYLKYVGVAILRDGNVHADMVSPEEFPAKDSALEELISNINKKHDKILSEVIGNTSVRLNGDREFIRTGETEFGNLITDAMREVAGADLAVTNGGGICASIEAGPVTKKDMITVFPYGNYVVTVKVTGQEIKDMLEHSVDGYPEPMQYFLQVSGLKYSFDAKKEVGKRVYDVYINGKKMSLTKTYLMATNNFLKNGGDQYLMLAEKAVVNEYDTIDEVLTKYIQANSNLAPKIEGRIQQKSQTVEELTDTKNTTKKTDKKKVKKASKKESQKKSTINKKNMQKTSMKKTVKSKATRIYVVRKNDNLSNIAKKELGSSTRWIEIYKLNKNKLKNPSIIYQGMKLYIPAK